MHLCPGRHSPHSQDRPRGFRRPEPDRITLSAGGGAVSANGSPTGLALRRLRDRAHLTHFLVARLRRKVGPPLDTWAGQVFWLDRLTSLCLSFPPKKGLL